MSYRALTLLLSWNRSKADLVSIRTNILEWKCPALSAYFGIKSLNHIIHTHPLCAWKLLLSYFNQKIFLKNLIVWFAVFKHLYLENLYIWKKSIVKAKFLVYTLSPFGNNFRLKEKEKRKTMFRKRPGYNFLNPFNFSISLQKYSSQCSFSVRPRHE
jgi:hypothetical protein